MLINKQNGINLGRFFFKPDTIDGVEFKPIKIDIHLGVVKIIDEEI